LSALLALATVIMEQHSETQPASETQHARTALEGQADEGSTTTAEAGGAEQWQQVANDLWAETAEFAQRIRKAMKKPAIGATVAGGAVLAAGVLWGASEAAVAVLGAYVAYRVLRRKDRSQKSEPSS